MEEWRAVDGGCSGASGGECGTAFGDVAESVVDSAFEELHFDEDELVIEAFEFFEQAVDERKGFVVGLLLHVEANEAYFKTLAQEALPLLHGPFDAGLGDGYLWLEGVGDGSEEVEQLADCNRISRTTSPWIPSIGTYLALPSSHG